MLVISLPAPRTEGHPITSRRAPCPPQWLSAQARLISRRKRRTQNRSHMAQPVLGLTPLQHIENLFHYWDGNPTFQYPAFKQDEIGIDTRSNAISFMGGLISAGNEQAIVRFYEQAFENLQQTNCRILAKAYIKLVEPQKQTKYPYNGRKKIEGRVIQMDPNETKPPWWPLQVRHREPDHLPKIGRSTTATYITGTYLTTTERIRLLVHILRELRSSHGITVKKLEEADRPIRYKMQPQSRLQFLDELYRVREQEERLFAEHPGWYSDKGMLINEINTSPKGWQAIHQPLYAEVSETAGKARPVSEYGDGVPNSLKRVQAKELLIGECGVGPSLGTSVGESALGQGMPTPMTSTQAVIHYIGNGQGQGQSLCSSPWSGTHGLGWNGGPAGTPMDVAIPINTTAFPNFSFNINTSNPGSTNPWHAYGILQDWAPRIPRTDYSLTDMPRELFESLHPSHSLPVG